MIRRGHKVRRSEKGRSFIEILVGLDGEMINDLHRLGRPSRLLLQLTVTKRFITSYCFRHASKTTYALAPLTIPPITPSRILLAVRRAQESQPIDAETIAKRTKRHLDELEVRSFRCGSLPTHYLMEAELRIAF